MTAISDTAMYAKIFQLKGSMVTVMVMEILLSDLEELAVQLEEKINAAPDFFQDTPIVLSLEKLGEEEMLDFRSLVSTCHSKGLFPFAIKGGSEKLIAAARDVGLVRISSGRAKSPIEVNKTVTEVIDSKKPTATSPDKEKREIKANQKSEVKKLPSKMITQPIRSGQQVYARDGDLIVLSSVSEGAEILADGNIHVYGALRGRALAGVQGDENARIFCSNLNASLISIAGVYLLNESINEKYIGKSVHISLDGEQLDIKSL